MFFRFGAALLLVVLISLAGTTLEKRSLELRRAVSRQHYQLDVLAERYSVQHATAQQLGAPARLIEQLDPELLSSAQPEKSTQPSPRPARKKRSGPATPNRPSF